MAEGGGEDVYETFNVLLRRSAKENNFKAILDSIRALMTTPLVVPDWLQVAPSHAVTYRCLTDCRSPRGPLSHAPPPSPPTPPRPPRRFPRPPRRFPPRASLPAAFPPPHPHLPPTGVGRSARLRRPERCCLLELAIRGSCGLLRFLRHLP